MSFFSYENHFKTPFWNKKKAFIFSKNSFCIVRKDRKISFIFFLLVLIISGCTSAPEGIPDANSDDTYTATITGQGTAPFTCRLVGATDIGGTLNLAQNCVITGAAPYAVETTIIPFNVEITDANGNSNTLEMTLTVHPPPVTLELPELIEASLGEDFVYSFCKPDPGLNCGEGSTNPTGGNPPYTFTISGQPMGLIMSLNGDLIGIIPELATTGEYEVEVCVKDTKGASDCSNTIIDVGEGYDPRGEWVGTITTTRSVTDDTIINHEWVDVRVDITEEANISFTLVSYEESITGKKSVATGNAQITIIATGPCPGEITESVIMESTPFFFNEESVAWRMESEVWDIPPPVEPKITFVHDSLPDVDLDINCGDWPDDQYYFSYDHMLFEGLDLYVLAEDGAVFEGTIKDRIYDKPVDVRIEIHKVK